MKYGHHKSVVSFYSAISVKDYQDTTLFIFLSKTPQSVVSIVWCPPSLAPPHPSYNFDIIIIIVVVFVPRLVVNVSICSTIGSF